MDARNCVPYMKIKPRYKAVQDWFAKFRSRDFLLKNA